VNDPADAYARLDAMTAALGPAERHAKELRRSIEQLALEMLRAGEPPTVVAERCPFTATHLRALARKAGIEPARRGGGRKPRPATAPQSD